jgi:hypothetical protein
MPNNLKPSSIRYNDIIRVSGKYHDMTITRTGTVAGRSHYSNITEYTTLSGAVLLQVFGDGTTDVGTATITLLRRPINSKPFDDTPDPSLFDLLDMEATS